MAAQAVHAGVLVCSDEGVFSLGMVESFFLDGHIIAREGGTGNLRFSPDMQLWYNATLQ